MEVEAHRGTRGGLACVLVIGLLVSVFGAVVSQTPTGAGRSASDAVASEQTVANPNLASTVPDPVGYWDMSTLRNGKIQNLADPTGATDGIIHNAIPSQDGIGGGSYNFDSVYGGTNTNIECPDPNSKLQFNDGTAAAWIKGTHLSLAECIMIRCQNTVPYPGWELAIYPGIGPSFPSFQYDALIFWAGPQGGSHSWVMGEQSVDHHMLDGNWHHVAVTFQGTSVRFYYDGVWDGFPRTSSTPVVSNPGEHLVIGNEDVVWWEPQQASFHGSIDEVKVFNTVLSDVEIGALHESPPTTPGDPMIMPGDEQDGTFTLTWTGSSDKDLTPVGGYALIESADGGPWMTVAENIPGTSYALTRSPGTYTYCVCAFDTSNPSLWSSWSGLTYPLILVPDTSPPVTSAQLSGTLIQGWYFYSVTITLTAADHSGISSTMYSLDSGRWKAYRSPITVTVTGSHTIQYYSTDTVGNVETAKSTSFQIDSSQPTTTAKLSGKLDKRSGSYIGPVTATLTATDTGSGIYRTYCVVDGGPLQLYVGPLVVSAIGAHTVQFASIDVVGNSEPWKSISFTIK